MNLALPPASGRLDFSTLAEHLGSQLEMFVYDEDPQPIEADTVQAARIFAFSGRTTCNGKHEARALTMAAMRLAGISKRKIARSLECSRNTIDAVMDHLERAGKIEPLKERLPRLLGATAEDAAERARELIQDGEVSTEVASMLKALGVIAGIGSDKVRDAAAASGDLHLHQHVHLESSDPGLEYLKSRAAALATDSEAAAASCKSLVLNGAPLESAALAAESMPPTLDLEPAAPVDADPPLPPDDPEPGEDEGAGGVEGAPPSQ